MAKNEKKPSVVAKPAEPTAPSVSVKPGGPVYLNAKNRDEIKARLSKGEIALRGPSCEVIELKK